MRLGANTRMESMTRALDAMRSSLDTLIRDGPQLADRMHFREWSPTHQVLAAAVRFQLLHRQDAPSVRLVGIIGGASSGKPPPAWVTVS